jgi:hypothetical protein
MKNTIKNMYGFWFSHCTWPEMYIDNLAEQLIKEGEYEWIGYLRLCTLIGLDGDIDKIVM